MIKNRKPCTSLENLSLKLGNKENGRTVGPTGFYVPF
jgi:hypothetical protein